MVDAVREHLPILLNGIGFTLLITAGSFLLSTILGLVLSLMQFMGNCLVAGVARGIVMVIRGIPMVVQLFYFYFVLPDLGIELTAVQAGIVGLGVGYSAYQAENFRAGLEAVDLAQHEAAEAMGMKPGLALRRVVLPQAFKIVLPAYGNIMVMMLKDSSLASTITVAELTRQGQLVAAATFQNMQIFTIVAMLYLAMSLPLMIFNRWLEARFRRAG
ncbi:amino acid ABC transporter permease [Paracoccus sp. (in: a-proteobacteria)]|uniref:amino acid ABC transporter permease n=1 Tax=Paracoccus sp. TaxID=267 RepID=UPI00321FF1F8